MTVGVLRSGEHFAHAHTRCTKMEETLNSGHVVDLLEELLPAQNQSYELGLKLKLPPERVQSIHDTYNGARQRLLHVMLEFANQEEPRPTRRLVVEALRSAVVGLPSLARKIEADHTPKCSATAQLPPTVSSAASGDLTD